MTQLPEILPVVFSTVEFALPLVVPVGQEITALGAPEDTKVERNSLQLGLMVDLGMTF